MEWISVKDRLPELEHLVLVWSINDGIRYCDLNKLEKDNEYWRWLTTELYWQEDSSCCRGEKNNLDQFTHWMQLPEKPKD